MPLPNQHAARMKDPGEFEKGSFRRVNDKFGPGIDAIFGRLKGKSTLTLQSIHFDSSKFTSSQAKTWLKEHDYSAASFEAATGGKAERSRGPDLLPCFYLGDGFNEIQKRNINEEARCVTFRAATENGVMVRGMGNDGKPGAIREHLRMSGANLKRFRSNGVILDAHDRSSVRNILGRGEVRLDKENKILEVDVTFAKTERGEEAYQLCKDDMVRAVSVGFNPEQVRNLAPGEKDFEMRGDKPDPSTEITGPARVVKRWSLYEISLLPVGADEDALRRSLSDWALQFFEDEPDPFKERKMDEKLFVRMCEKHKVDPSTIDEEKRVALETEFQRELCALVDAPAAPEKKPETKPAEKSVKERMLEIAPRSLSAEVVDGCILAATDFEDGRKRMQAEYAKVTKPAGTPPDGGQDVIPPEKREKKKDEEKKITDEQLIASMRSL